MSACCAGHCQWKPFEPLDFVFSMPRFRWSFNEEIPDDEQLVLPRNLFFPLDRAV